MNAVFTPCPIKVRDSMKKKPLTKAKKPASRARLCSADAVANEVVKKLYWITGINEFAAEIVPKTLRGQEAGGYSQMDFHKAVCEALRSTKRFR